MFRTLQSFTAILSLIFFVAVSFMFDQLQIKQLGIEIGVSAAYAGGQIYATRGPVPPMPYDPSVPSPHVMFSWARLAGRAEAVYLNIPSNQLDKVIILPIDPSPLIFIKYDPVSNTATVALFRLRQVGANLTAKILKLTPTNFGTCMSPDFNQFAWLDWNTNAGCDYASNQLSMAHSPQLIGVTNGEIIRDFEEYDRGMTSFPPAYIFTPSEQSAINQSAYYWHQRLNNSACWNHVSLSGFDNGSGDGNFHGLSQTGLYNLASFAVTALKAAGVIIITPQFSSQVQQSTQSTFFTKKVTTTVSYFMQPQWTVGTRAGTGSYCEVLVNSTQAPRFGDVCFVSANDRGTFPMDKTLVYQYSNTQSGWTGLFVFVACIVIGAIGGVGGALALDSVFGDIAGAVAAGAGAGAVGGLIASGFSPTTNTTASITPFYDSSYDFSTPNLPGDMAQVQANTDAQWLNTDMLSTPGQSRPWIGAFDPRAALACGGASHTGAACTAPVIEQLSPEDPRYKSAFEEMWTFPTKDLMRATYPWVQP